MLGYLYRRFKYLEFTGNEDFKQYKDKPNSNGICEFYTYIQDYNPVYKECLKCTHFTFTNNLFSSETNECIKLDNDGRIAFRVLASRASTVEQFKQWIASQTQIKLAILYPIKANTVETIEIEPINAPTGENTIDVDTVVKPSKIEIYDGVEYRGTIKLDGIEGDSEYNISLSNQLYENDYISFANQSLVVNGEDVEITGDMDIELYTGTNFNMFLLKNEMPDRLLSSNDGNCNRFNFRKDIIQTSASGVEAEIEDMECALLIDHDTLCIRNDSCSTLSEFRNYIQNNITIVSYITNIPQSVTENIPEIKTFRGPQTMTVSENIKGITIDYSGA